MDVETSVLASRQAKPRSTATLAAGQTGTNWCSTARPVVIRITDALTWNRERILCSRIGQKDAR
jgi:hypothetical protein